MTTALLIETILQFLPYVGIIIAWFFKDKILHAVNVQLKKTQVKSAEKQLDTVYIENSEKLVNLYQKSMDDLDKRNAKTIQNIKDHYQKELEGIHKKYTEEREKDKEEWDKVLEKKKSLRTTVELLQQQVQKLTEEVQKLTDQLNYYRKNTDIELPDNLK